MIRCLVALGLLGTLALSACKQGVGERCMVNADCDDDLICILAVGATPQTGGTCELNLEPDLGGEADLSVVD